MSLLLCDLGFELLLLIGWREKIRAKIINGMGFLFLLILDRRLIKYNINVPDIELSAE